ncbi:MAG: protein kinase [Gemmatimonadaceae bacterium]
MLEVMEYVRTAIAERYTVEKELGRGGMATVFLALDRKHERHVALKILHPHVASALGADRFLREIKLTSRLQHPHILPLHDSGQIGELLYYVMPYVEGESLRQIMEREAVLSVDKALRIGLDVTSALGYAHARGIIHRDIKPENILLSGEHAVVADFGIARAVSTAGGENLTDTGFAVGTVRYMSPEQAAGERGLDGRSDLYSLGCVIYEMLAGRSPLIGANGQLDFARRYVEKPLELRVIRPEVPAGVEEALARVLQPNPDRRFATADEFAAAVRSAIDASPQSARRALPASLRVMRGRLRRWQVPAAIAVLATMVVGGAMVSGEWRPWEQRSYENAGEVTQASVVVVPFSVVGMERSLEDMGEDMASLLSDHFSGQVGPRAIHGRTVASKVRELGIRKGDDVSVEQAYEIARRLGATEAILGKIVRVPGGVEISATRRDLSSDSTLQTAKVTGTLDDWALKTHDLTAQLLAGEAGETGEQLAKLSESSKALLEYVRARAASRRAEYRRAVGHFEAALEYDTAFAMAAMGLAYAASFIPDRTRWHAAVSKAWAHADRLSERDRRYLIARAGPQWPNRSLLGERIAAWSQAVAVNPDRLEALYEWGDELFHRGSVIAGDTVLVLARDLFRRAIQLDSLYLAPLAHLLELEIRTGDTAAVRSLDKLYSVRDSTTVSARFLRWRVAVALRDNIRHARERGQLDRAETPVLIRILAAAQLDGVAMADAESVATLLRSRARLGDRPSEIHLQLYYFALNRGRPLEAAAELKALQTPRELLNAQAVVDQVYWDGDSAIATARVRHLARFLNSGFDTIKSRIGEQYSALCNVTQWQLAHNQTSAARPVVKRLQSILENQDYDPEIRGDMAVCAALLEARLARAKIASSRAAIDRLDSLKTLGGYELLAQANFTIARLREARGDIAGALTAVRQRPYHQDAIMYLSTYLREEARLAAAAGDTAIARRAFQHYATLRADPEPSVLARDVAFRAELEGRLRTAPASGRQQATASRSVQR